MDKPYLLGRDTTGNQLLTHIVINIESAVILRGGKVAEYKLCSFCVGVILPDTIHIVDAGVDLAIRVIRQHRVNHSLVESQLASVIRDFEHIINVRLYKPCPDFLSSACKSSYHFGLYLARLGLDIVVIYFRHGEF